MRSTGLRPARRIGIQPSQNSMTRSKVRGPSPPMTTGGCGFCTGFGQDQIGSKLTNSPWNSASSSLQISFIARTRSRSSRQRVWKSVPWFSISSTFQPPPMPNRKRPFGEPVEAGDLLGEW